MTGGSEEFRIRSLTGSVFLPSLLFAVGQGAAIPILPLLALELGLSVPMAGAVVAARALGTLVFDLPAGFLVSRFGERKAMLAGTLGLVVSAIGIGLGPSALVLAVLVFLMGGAWSVWLLARVAYAAEITPFSQRGRVMSILGGLGRIGAVVGPLLGGAVVAAFGLAAAFYLQAAFAVLALVALWLRTLPLEKTAVPPVRLTHHLVRHMVEHKRLMLTMATVSVVVQMLRSARDAILPFWGDAIDLSPSQISLVFSVMSAAEVASFYPAGIASDRFGRKWSVVPCLGLLTIGLAALPTALTLGSLIAIGIVIGVGNGFGAGMQMTLGADLAPPDAVAGFLGIWRMGADAGAVGGPAVVAAASGVSLVFAALSMAVFGVVGLGVVIFLFPKRFGKASLGLSP